MPSTALKRLDPRLRPPRTFKVVLLDEQSGQIIREKRGISEAHAAKLCELLDVGAGVVSAAAELIGAARTIGRVLEPLTSPAPRKLPRRRS